MAYQAKKHKRFQEDFELVNEDGEVAHVLHVDLDADDMAFKIGRKYQGLVKSLAEATEIKRKAEKTEQIEESVEKLGRAVVNMLEAVFGEEDAAIILEFYENRYIELTKEVIPFISQVVVPRCIDLRNENKKEILKKYNRTQRRALFKR